MRGPLRLRCGGWLQISALGQSASAVTTEASRCNTNDKPVSRPRFVEHGRRVKGLQLTSGWQCGGWLLACCRLRAAIVTLLSLLLPPMRPHECASLMRSDVICSC